MFLSAAIRRPHVVGAVLPSSPALAKRLAAVVPRQGAPVVVELGAGTGSVSRQIRDRLGGTGRHIAVELDGALVDFLRANEPGIDVAHGTALHLDDLLDVRGVQAVDVVVGGLPWALIGPGGQRVIVGHVAEALGPHGVFTTFAYLHALPLGGARRFRRLLESTFDEVLPTRVVWRNVPPALTYVCRRPHSAG
jgi:phospholipid N-methyltransferase